MSSYLFFRTACQMDMSIMSQVFRDMKMYEKR